MIWSRNGELITVSLTKGPVHSYNEDLGMQVSI